MVSLIRGHDDLHDEVGREPLERVVAERPLKLGDDESPEAALRSGSGFRFIHDQTLTVWPARCELKNFGNPSFETMSRVRKD